MIDAIYTGKVNDGKGHGVNISLGIFTQKHKAINYAAAENRWFFSFLQTKNFNLRKLFFSSFHLTLKISIENDLF